MTSSKRWMAGLIGLLLLAASAPARARDLTGDETKIRALIDGFVAAWNHHDPDGLAARFDVDADCSDPWGSTAKGRDEIARMAGDREGFFATTTFAVSGVAIRPVSNDAAIVELNGRVMGLQPPNASAPQAEETIELVVSQREQRWLIASIRSFSPMTPIAAIPEPVLVVTSPLRVAGVASLPR